MIQEKRRLNQLKQFNQNLKLFETDDFVTLFDHELH